ncbi:MAG: aminotransferase class V-fold PLP-dependent enzyme [Anaerolineae bacterium]|nr:aminotransferase class V-fold PLP-dependent enzyme [Anaerolineae bacterium]
MNLQPHVHERAASNQPASDDAAFASALADFQHAYPEYAATEKLDALRATDYARLDQAGHIYLDYTGGGLYAETQLRQHLELLSSGVFGNPHSQNPTSLAMTHLVEDTRDYVLKYFNASPDEYLVIFTPNATGALKLVGEAYPFTSGGHYALTFDNHNSVNGIREFARAKGAEVTYIPVVAPHLRTDPAALAETLKTANPQAHNLFAYPAQSNFSGVQHPLEWIEMAQEKGWDVLLDAAAFVPSNRLDLSVWHPDFVSISFYKIFGYPTGMGCLIARKTAVQKLHRPWYAGGTLSFSSVRALDFYLTPGNAGFEDGTVNYLCIPAVKIGLQFIESISIETIHHRVMALTGWLIDQLLQLRHSSGSPMIKIYGPPDLQARGSTIQSNFFDPAGNLIECTTIERMASAQHISLRAGCHCNPGTREVALNLSEDEMRSCFRDKDSLSFEQFLHVIDDKLTGALRASIGLATNFADVYRYVLFAKSFQDKFIYPPN